MRENPEQLSFMGVKTKYPARTMEAALKLTMAHRAMLHQTFGPDRRVEQVINFCCPMAPSFRHAPSAEAIADMLNAPRTSVVRLLSHMVEDGWLERSREGRRVVYQSTPEGTKAVVKSLTSLLDSFDRILSA